MKLVYRAYHPSGASTSATIEAASIADATESLRRKGLFVSEIRQAGETTAAQVKRQKTRPGRRLKLLTAFTRQLYVLISTGTALVDALTSLERQATDPAWKRVLNKIRSRVEEGSTLADAMAAHPEYFDSICRSLVAAGESGGSFGSMLDRLSQLTTKQLQIRSTIVGALLYPSLLIVVAMGVLTLMIVFVVPRFSELFQSLDVPLPPSTAVLMWVSATMSSYWYAVLGLLLISGMGLKLWLSTQHGEHTYQTVMLRLPRLGYVAQGLATARIARVLGALLQSRVPLIDSLQLSRDVTGNHHYADLMVRAEDAVTRGEAISSAFNNTKLVRVSVYEAIRNGENNGQIGPSLLNVADFLDQENDVVLRSLTSILEPLILIALGLIVAVVALSMFMPLFDLTAMTG